MITVTQFKSLKQDKIYVIKYIAKSLNKFTLIFAAKKPRQQQHTQQTERIAKLIKVEY